MMLSYPGVGPWWYHILDYILGVRYQPWNTSWYLLVLVLLLLERRDLNLHLEFNGVLCYLREEWKPSIDVEISSNLLELTNFYKKVSVKCERFFLCVLELKQCKNAWLKASDLTHTYFLASFAEIPRILARLQSSNSHFILRTREIKQRNLSIDSPSRLAEIKYSEIPWPSNFSWCKRKFLEHFSQVMK